MNSIICNKCPNGSHAPTTGNDDISDCLPCDKNTANDDSTGDCIPVPEVKRKLGAFYYITYDNGISFIVVSCDNTRGYK